jgi:DNA-binding MarR family transcriptional regulator
LKATAWAYAQDGFSLAQKSVLVAIAASVQPEQGYAFISKDQLARKVSTGRKTVTYAITALVGRGLLRVEPTIADDGGTLANRYHLTIDTDAASAAAEQETR